jgi:hypothetical protein
MTPTLRDRQGLGSEPRRRIGRELHAVTFLESRAAFVMFDSRAERLQWKTRGIFRFSEAYSAFWGRLLLEGRN